MTVHIVLLQQETNQGTKQGIRSRDVRRVFRRRDLQFATASYESRRVLKQKPFETAFVGLAMVYAMAAVRTADHNHGEALPGSPREQRSHIDHAGHGLVWNVV